MAEESFENNFFDTPSPTGGLRARVVRGGFWVFALRITTRLFGLARTIILARLLAPADFGLFGIALLAMSALQTFSQTGFGAALVQKKEDIELYLDTAWTVKVIRGVVLGLIAFATAPYVAAFFNAPAAKPILQVIAFSELLKGFTNIGVVYFRKELEFHKLFVYQLGGTLADISVAIPAAFLLRSVWALVFGLLAGNVVRIVLSYFIHPYRPRIRFNRQQFKELFGFGKWVLGSTIIIFLITQGDDIFVGKLLGVTALGFYQLAYRLSNMPATEITHVISQVTFPAYSKLQDNTPKLREAYLKVLQITAFFSFPIAGLIFVLAPDFTKIFLGQKWMPMVPAMQVLVVWGLIRSIGATMGPVFHAVGRPDILTKLVFLRLMVLVILIYPLSVNWGIVGTSVAVLTSSFFVTPFTTYVTIRKVLKGSTLRMAKITVFIPFIGAVTATLLLSLFVKEHLSIPGFLLAVVATGVAYIIFTYVLDKIFKHRLVENLVATAFPKSK